MCDFASTCCIIVKASSDMMKPLSVCPCTRLAAGAKTALRREEPAGVADSGLRENTCVHKLAINFQKWSQ